MVSIEYMAILIRQNVVEVQISEDCISSGWMWLQDITR